MLTWDKRLQRKIRYHQGALRVAVRLKRSEMVEWHEAWLKATQKELKDYQDDQERRVP